MNGHERLTADAVSSEYDDALFDSYLEDEVDVAQPPDELERDSIEGKRNTVRALGIRTHLCSSPDRSCSYKKSIIELNVPEEEVDNTSLEFDSEENDEPRPSEVKLSESFKALLRQKEKKNQFINEDKRFIPPSNEGIQVRISATRKALNSQISKTYYYDGIVAKLLREVAALNRTEISTQNFTGEKQYEKKKSNKTIIQWSNRQTNQRTWQMALCYGGRRYDTCYNEKNIKNSQEDRSLQFYSRLAETFERKWVSIKPIVITSLSGLITVNNPFNTTTGFTNKNESNFDNRRSSISKNNLIESYEEKCKRFLNPDNITSKSYEEKTNNLNIPMKIQKELSYYCDENDLAVSFLIPPLRMKKLINIPHFTDKSKKIYNNNKYINNKIIKKEPQIHLLWLCCGGKDMLALDWLPLLSNYLRWKTVKAIKSLNIMSLIRENKKITNNYELILLNDSAFLLVEYPAHGLSTGSCTPEGCVSITIQSLYHALTKLQIFNKNPIEVRLLGYSLGAAIAIEVALKLIHGQNSQGIITLKCNSQYLQKEKKEKIYLSSSNNNSSNPPSRQSSSDCLSIPNTINNIHPIPKTRRSRSMPLSSIGLGIFESSYKKNNNNIIDEFEKKRNNANQEINQHIERYKRFLEKTSKNNQTNVIDTLIEDINIYQSKSVSFYLSNIFLIAPFSSTTECATHFFRMPSLLRPVVGEVISIFQDPNTRWDNVASIQRLIHLYQRRTKENRHSDRILKIFIFHGTEDTVVPLQLAERLFEAATSIVGVTGTQHTHHHCDEEFNMNEGLYKKERRNTNENNRVSVFLNKIVGATHRTICCDFAYLNYIFNFMRQDAPDIRIFLHEHNDE